MKNTLASNFKENNLQKIIEEVAHNDAQVIYPGGPLNKNNETKLFERIIIYTFSSIFII